MAKETKTLPLAQLHVIVSAERDSLKAIIEDLREQLKNTRQEAERLAFDLEAKHEFALKLQGERNELLVRCEELEKEAANEAATTEATVDALHAAIESIARGMASAVKTY